MSQENNNMLFGEFPPVSTEAWEEKIIEDLKGADYEKRLVWKTHEGIKVQPYYRSEHLEDIPHMHVFPGEAPYVRGAAKKGNDWAVRQDFEETDPDKVNALALQAVSKGADAVGFNVSGLAGRDDLAKMLRGLDPEKTAMHFLHGKDYPALIDHLDKILDKKQLTGSVDFDPFGYFLLYGKYPFGKEEDLHVAKTLLNRSRDLAPGFYVINVNGTYLNHAGASAVQEMAFALSQGNEYLAYLTGMGLVVDDIAPRMQFSFSIGSNYFLEIAKLRAVRMLWSKIVEQYKPSDEGAGRMVIHAVTSEWNKSIYDAYVNMLRTTTEAMAASIGGADSLTVNPFDSTFKNPDEFSYRMARNQQIILKHEAYFSKVADPAAGSYYVEKLTDSLARAAFDLFLETENRGGFLRAAESGWISESVEETCRKRDMDIAMRKQVFVGTNLYPNSEEQMLAKVEPRSRLSDLAGLRQYRGTQSFEALRMAVEHHVSKGFEKPKVFLFTYGNAAMRKARATFSSNFFGVAGYTIIDNLGFPDLDTGVDAALKSEAEIVVLCSSDEEYVGMVSAATAIKKQSPETLVVVAGNPKEIIDQLQEAGVDYFIHIRTNVLEALQRYNELLGIV
ncbi:MAG: methylmalonyl-CoA mutase small subunit [Bacteroidia bacterium]|nr:MAG: methylmalonyl-CoA mutase small subunit [Bacteroidia bacterium]